MLVYLVSMFYYVRTSLCFEAPRGLAHPRRGYGGDGHTSYQFALANYPVGAFFNKWTRDFADVQGVPGGFGTPAGTGLVPNTAPTVGGGGGPAWSGFVVTNPWQTYNTFGDTDILEDMYPCMTQLLAFYGTVNPGSLF